VKVLKTIAAGQQGSRKFQRAWGKQLLNVRYRENQRSYTIITTIEIVVDERPRPPKGVDQHRYLAQRDQTVVGVKINFEETDLRKKIKASGGVWDLKHKLWFVYRPKAIALGLKERIVKLKPQDYPDIDIRQNMRHGHI